MFFPFGFNMPWYENLYQVFPLWVAILNIVIFSSLAIIIFTPIKNRLSNRQLYSYCITNLVSFFFLDISLRKAPAYIGPLMFLALMSIYVIFKRKEAVKIKEDKTSKEVNLLCL